MSETKPEKMFRMATDIAKNRGIFEFWRGLSPTLWRDVPFSAIYWTLIEQFRSSSYLKNQSTFVTNLVSGTICGGIAALLTHPFDVVKTRKQVFQLAGRSAPFTTFGTISHIIEVEGIRGLTVGMLPRVVKIAPSTAIMLTSYELGKRFFRDTL